LAAAGVLLLTALLARELTAPYAVAILIVASIYMALAFTIAFRNFSKLSSDQHVTAHGIAWSILPVLIAIVLWKLDMPYASASTPLGAIYALFNLGTSSLLDNPEILEGCRRHASVLRPFRLLAPPPREGRIRLEHAPLAQRAFFCPIAITEQFTQNTFQMRSTTWPKTGEAVTSRRL